jgi:hypothetical protein
LQYKGNLKNVKKRQTLKDKKRGSVKNIQILVNKTQTGIDDMRLNEMEAFPTENGSITYLFNSDQFEAEERNLSTLKPKIFNQ